MPPLAHTNLLQQIAEGDEQAFQQLYNQHWYNIYGQALAYTKSITEAQDLVQEVFIQVWEKRQQLADVASPADFLFIIARNLIISSLRKKARKELKTIDQGLQEATILPDDFLLPDSNIIHKQSEAIIQQAIENLTTQQKQIFILSRTEGLNHEQIAERLGISKFTVKNHIVAALHSIRQRLSREELLVLLPLFILAGEKI